MSDYTIRVEAQMTNPPKPVGFGVFCDGKWVACLTIEQLRDAMARYEKMDREHGSPPLPSG